MVIKQISKNCYIGEIKGAVFFGYSMREVILKCATYMGVE